MELAEIIDLERYPLGDGAFRAQCLASYRATGALALEGFMRPAAIEAVRAQGEAQRAQVFAKREEHTVYLSRPDPALPADHPRNRMVVSTKGCLTDDQIDAASPLRALYDSAEFRAFLGAVVEEGALHPYADPLSSINLHFHEQGQELGWHFDNSSFAITLMVQAAQAGGLFEYVPNLRNADAGDMNYEGVAEVLGGQAEVTQLAPEPGTLLVFRGRNSIHRVSPNAGARTRMLAVLAYNTEPGIALSETARLTFYGRTG